MTASASPATTFVASDNVEFTRQEVLDASPDWQIVSDTAEGGERTVKERGTDYLPAVRGDEADASNRYEVFKNRAVFVNFAGRTLNWLVGQIWRREPTTNLAEYENLYAMFDKNVDGKRVTLAQFARRLTRLTCAFGRAGLMVDYPNQVRTVDADGNERMETVTETKAADRDSGRVRPVFRCYRPQDIINWDTDVIGSEEVLTMVVLRETYNYRAPTGFAVEERIRYRVLKLVANESGTGHCAEVSVYHRKDENEKQTPPEERPEDYVTNSDEMYTLCGHNRVPLERLPFTFVGSVNNDETIDPSPIYPIAAINLGHYRNSACFEESVFMGNPTPWASGISADYKQEHYPDGRIRIGSLGFVTVPPGEQFGLAQPSPNTLAQEGMRDKEEQMQKLGAKLITDRATQRTATEAANDDEAESSVLESIAKNVSAAIEFGLMTAMLYMPDSPTPADTDDDSDDDSEADVTSDEIMYQLNSDFELATMSTERINALIQLSDKGHILDEEMHRLLKKGGVVEDEWTERKERMDAAKDEAHERAIQEQADMGLIMGGMQNGPPEGPPNNGPPPNQSGTN